MTSGDILTSGRDDDEPEQQRQNETESKLRVLRVIKGNLISHSITFFARAI